ncbi:MAG: zf-HC2 domain-containing protein [Candidatus Eisenbacteria bacterium]
MTDKRILISGYLDGELTPDERAAFERELARDPALGHELDALQSMREVTARMKLKEFPDAVWDRYWEGTYNRLERRIGWILLSLGATVLLAVGLYGLAVALLKDAGEPWWIRAAVGAVCAGLAILCVSVVRERLVTAKKDPYREVKR